MQDNTEARRQVAKNRFFNELASGCKQQRVLLRKSRLSPKYSPKTKCSQKAGTQQRKLKLKEKLRGGGGRQLESKQRQDETHARRVKKIAEMERQRKQNNKETRKISCQNKGGSHYNWDMRITQT